MATSLRHPESGATATGEPVYYSAEMVDALNDGDNNEAPRYECVYGELFVHVSPPRPWHQMLVGRLYNALRAYQRREPAAGYVSPLASKITFQRPDIYVQPDLWVVGMEEWRAQDWNAITVPLLLAEVLSDSTQRLDRFQKRRAYMEAGVPLYWVIDGDARHVEVWTPGVDFPRFEREQLVWHPEGAREPFTYALAELFAPV